MFAFLRQLFTPQPTADAPWRRWTPEELQTTRRELDGKPTESWSIEDHLQAVEFVVQRYLPPDVPISESEWLIRKGEFRVKIEQNIADAKAGKETVAGWEWTNQELARIREALKSSYAMSQAEFQDIVLPALARFPFASDIEGLPTGQQALLWQASDAYQQGAHHERQDARDALVGTLHPVAIDTASALRSNYEVLRRAQIAGCTKVRIVVTRTECTCLSSLLNEKTAAVDDLLAAFASPDGPWPLMPPSQTPCGAMELPRVCAVVLIPIENVSRPTDDPEFAKVLDSILSGGVDTGIRPDWKAELQRAMSSNWGS